MNKLAATKDPRRAKIREKKKIYNKKYSEFISKLIEFKRFINGKSEEHQIKIDEPFPSSSSGYLSELSGIFSELASETNEIVHMQNEYANSRVKHASIEKQALSMFDVKKRFYLSKSFFRKDPVDKLKEDVVIAGANFRKALKDIKSTVNTVSFDQSTINEANTERDSVSSKFDIFTRVLLLLNSKFEKKEDLDPKSKSEKLKELYEKLKNERLAFGEIISSNKEIMLKLNINEINKFKSNLNKFEKENHEIYLTNASKAYDMLFTEFKAASNEPTLESFQDYLYDLIKKEAMVATASFKLVEKGKEFYTKYFGPLSGIRTEFNIVCKELIEEVEDLCYAIMKDNVSGIKDSLKSINKVYVEFNTAFNNIFLHWKDYSVEDRKERERLSKERQKHQTQENTINRELRGR